jgi:serine/threonine-protein kinase
VQQADSAPAGTVIAQSPQAGATAAAGSSVTLTVSSGPAVGTTTAPSTTTTPSTPTGVNTQVPSLVGQTYDTASSMLTQSGLTLGSITYQASVQTPGTVISQNPAAGASVAQGSAVSVVVSQ